MECFTVRGSKEVAAMITYQNQQSHSVREFMRGGRKHVELTKLLAQLPENMRMFNVLTLIPGASIGYHVHEGETELFYFLEGTQGCPPPVEPCLACSGAPGK